MRPDTKISIESVVGYQCSEVVFVKDHRKIQNKIPKTMDIFKKGFYDDTEVLMRSEKYRKRLRAINAIGRLIKKFAV